MTLFGEQIKLWVAPYKNEVFWWMIIRKPKKKSTLFFLLNLVPFNEQNYDKWQGPGTSDQLLFRFSLLLMYYLTKFNQTVFKLFQKLHLLMEANLWHHKLFNFHLSSQIWCSKQSKILYQARLWIVELRIFRVGHSG